MTTEFHFFGGKGGVGKTTCAAAFAVARAQAGARVLAISTDPAHSLGDALGVRLSSRATRVSAGRRRTFSALELDAPRAFARWLDAHRRALRDILEHGTWLEHADIDALLQLSIPGVDEFIAMLEIARLAAGDRDATVVVDTAPTGHALRLLLSPDAVTAAASVLDDLQRDHRVIRQQLARVTRPEAADRFIVLLSEQARTAAALVRDRSRVTLHWVMLPEELSLSETDDALRALNEAEIHVQELILNRVMPDGSRCPICDRRRAAERAVIARVPQIAGRQRAIRIVEAQPNEPKGVRGLASIGERLTAVTPPSKGGSPERRSAQPVPSMAVSAPSRRGRNADALEQLARRQLLFFGGKGGVGKTTVAASMALALADAQRQRTMLLVSTDPAHSLGDVFATAIDDEARAVPGAPANLPVRELDAAAELASRRRKIEAALEEILESVGSIGGAAAGRGVADLMDLAPPGVDELFGLLGVLDAQERYDTILVDTAPTGHALRLLEMPEVARAWVQVLLRLMIKYREVVRPGALASELVDLSRQVRAVQELLHDRQRTTFVIVTRAAEVPRMETERLARRLARLRIPSPVMIVNALTLSPGACPWCRAMAARERRELPRLSRACPSTSLRAGRSTARGASCAIIQAPLAQPPPRGVPALQRWAHAWVGSTKAR